jgi:hypothetical protein
MLIRKDVTNPAPAKLRHELPFSSAFKLQEEKYNRENWVEKGGYYAVGSRESAKTTWQSGCGGPLVTQPLIFGGSALSKERALRTFDFLFPKGQSKSGFFHAVSDGKAWYEDGFFGPPSLEIEREHAGAAARKPSGHKHSRKWHLVRRSADVLYAMVKQFMLLGKQEASFKPKSAWTKGVVRCADGFVKLWDKYKQFGQFVNIDTGDVIVGGSASAAIAPAGLALASQYYKNEEYLRIAKAAGLHFHERFIRAGVTNGGPADALQCPDSESAVGILESFVVLHEVTGDKLWIDRAVEAAHQLASWAIAYDHVLPPGSSMAKLGIQTTGAILANAQNKHATPGLVIASGDSLFKLYRATGNAVYLELLRDTAHNITQYVSRLDRTIDPNLPVGSLCGHINTSDWTDAVGEASAAPRALEACSLLTAVEVPGIYAQPDTGFVFVFDHVEARVKDRSDKRLVVAVRNPTAHEAAVRIFSESSMELSRPLGPNALWGGRQITLPPGGEQDVELERG